jgi:hypothetical protein
MRGFRTEPLGRMPGRAIQCFEYGPLQFNVNRAALLAGNKKKYQPEFRHPSPDWIGPYIDVDERYAERARSSQPVIFATLLLPGHPRNLLIDGNHRVLHALKYGQGVKAIFLDLEDTLKIVSGPRDLIQQMKDEGQRLGLAPSLARQVPSP